MRLTVSRVLRSGRKPDWPSDMMGSSRWETLVATTLSASLAMTLVRAMGLYDAALVVSFPGLGMGTIFDLRQAPGTMPEERDRERSLRRRRFLSTRSNAAVNSKRTESVRSIRFTCLCRLIGRVSGPHGPHSG